MGGTPTAHDPSLHLPLHLDVGLRCALLLLTEQAAPPFTRAAVTSASIFQYFAINKNANWNIKAVSEPDHSSAAIARGRRGRGAAGLPARLPLACFGSRATRQLQTERQARGHSSPFGDEPASGLIDWQTARFNQGAGMHARSAFPPFPRSNCRF